MLGMVTPNESIMAFIILFSYVFCNFEIFQNEILGKISTDFRMGQNDTKVQLEI